MAQPHQGPNKGHPATTDGLSVVHHVHRAKVLFRSAYELERWQKGPKRSDIRKAQEHRRAIRVAKTRKQLAEFRDKLAERFHAYAQEQQEVAALTPYDCGVHGSYAVPCTIVARESGYDQDAENPSSSAGGWYQIIDDSWFGYGGSDNGCYHVAACASALEQHQVASRMWAGGAGASHWSQTYP